MAEDGVVQVRGLTKRYGPVTAVADLGFDVVPGAVTAFVGRNGAGKSTTLRLLLGLERPTAGTALVAGRPYAELDRPLLTAGALLDSGGAHPGRTARAHLRWLAASNRLPARRVVEVLDAVGLREAADRRVRGFSLGMRQRLGVAAALLGDPAVLLLDEPTNGLDPEGIRWLRTTLRGLAAEGRTVLVSSHLMGEVARTADRVLVVAAGRLVADTTVAELVGGDAGPRLRVGSTEPRRLAELLAAGGVPVERGPDGVLLVSGASRQRVGEVAARHGVPLLELTDDERSLEDAVLALTAPGDAP